MQHYVKIKGVMKNKKQYLQSLPNKQPALHFQQILLQRKCHLALYININSFVIHIMGKALKPKLHITTKSSLTFSSGIMLSLFQNLKKYKKAYSYIASALNHSSIQLLQIYMTKLTSFMRKKCTTLAFKKICQEVWPPSTIQSSC